jgi:hypothetical protein
MNRKPLINYVIVCALVAVLAACAPSGPSQEDLIATSVAATLSAGQPAATATLEPVQGVTVAPVVQSCANTGQVNVAYVKDGGVWLSVEGAPGVQLTNNGDANDVRISDDGCLIAYARAVPNVLFDPGAEFPMSEFVDELWVISSDGSYHQSLANSDFFNGLQRPADVAGMSLHGFEWQPGTHVLAFNSRLTLTGPGLATANDLYLVNVDTLAITTLLGPEQAGDFYFSPDGSKLAYSASTSIGVIDVDGGNHRANLVQFPIVFTYSEYNYMPRIHWTPDSMSFMVAIPAQDGLAQPVDGIYPETRLFYVPLDGTPAFEAGALQAAWFVEQEVVFSPDAGHIAYLRPVGDPTLNERELVIALSDGSNESTQLIYHDIKFGAWAPNNDAFIFTYRDPEFHIFQSNLDATAFGPISQLTAFSAASAQIEWIDADRFVMMLSGDSGAELSLMHTSGAGSVIDTFGGFAPTFDVAN